MSPAVALVRGRDARTLLPATLTVAAGRSHTADTILRAWFEGKAEHTIRSDRHDLEDFALYFSRALGISPPPNRPASGSTRFGFSRHKTLATMLIYRDEHDREATQRTLADVVASTLTT
jgi:hypothetical protein